MNLATETPGSFYEHPTQLLFSNETVEDEQEGTNLVEFEWLFRGCSNNISNVMHDFQENAIEQHLE